MIKLCYLFHLFLFIGLANYAQKIPVLNSRSSAKPVIYLDFDGYYIDSSSQWFNYFNKPSSALPAGYTVQEITQVFDIVAEDYRPFEINVTTDSTVFEKAPYNKRVRVVITPTSSWYSNWNGGVAYIGSFSWGDDTPAWAFSSNLQNSKYIGDVCSHEAGHTLGLGHHGVYDKSCNLTNPYDYGRGEGEISWAPIMGASYYTTLGTWAFGDPLCPESIKDDIGAITASLTLRTDDHADSSPGATLVDFGYTSTTTLSLKASGLIASSSDSDVFKFVVPAETKIRLAIRPAAKKGEGNIDLKAGFWKEGSRPNNYAPPKLLSVLIDTLVGPGNYYLFVSGDGNINSTNYGSLGSYLVVGEGIISIPLTVNLGSDTAICAGSSLLLNAGHAGAGYLWSTGAATQTIRVSDSGTYSVKVNVNGLHLSDTIVVSAFANPLVDLGGSDTALCKGSLITLSAENGEASYLWSTGDTSSSITIQDSGRYAVVVIENGCSATDSINVSVRSSLSADFDFVIQEKTKLLFSATLESCYPVKTFEWNFGDGSTSQLPSPNHLYEKPGLFEVSLTVTDEQGSSFTSKRNILIREDPKEISFSSLLTSGELLINSSYYYEYQLISLSGQTLKKGFLKPGINRIDAAALARGLYLLRLSRGPEKTTKKLIKL